MMSTKKNKKRVLTSSSDEEEDNPNPNYNLTPTTTTDTEKICPRSSQRLKKKSQRSSFVLPSRNKVWDTIPSESSSKKDISLSPRKTVNDFTKVYNTYNFDDYEDTSYDESEGFCTDSSEGSHSEEDSSKKRKSGRVKNFRRRIKLCSSSDEEKSSTDKESVNRKCDQLKSEIRQSTDEQDKLVAPVGIGDESATLNNVDDFVDFEENCNVVDENSGDDGISPMKRCRTTSILESDSDSKSESESSDVSGTSESSHDESESESDVCNDSRSSKFKRKKDELFQKFKDVQKVRKAAQKTLVSN